MSTLCTHYHEAFPRVAHGMQGPQHGQRREPVRVPVEGAWGQERGSWAVSGAVRRLRICNAVIWTRKQLTSLLCFCWHVRIPRHAATTGKNRRTCQWEKAVRYGSGTGQPQGHLPSTDCRPAPWKFGLRTPLVAIEYLGGFERCSDFVRDFHYRFGVKHLRRHVESGVHEGVRKRLRRHTGVRQGNISTSRRNISKEFWSWAKWR